MQDSIVRAFRKRMQKRGYTDITIKKSKESLDTYLVTATEPLFQTKLSGIHSLVAMYHLFSPQKM